MNNDPLQFLKGGGEMGALTRTYDWSGTPMGSPETWPQSLRTTVALLLSSRFPMFLWWGDELIQFYNDAYRPSLGTDGKHPTALGQCGEACWPEIWPVIKPLIDQVRAGKGATWSENQLIPIYRNGRLEDVYWTFSYNPVMNDSDDIGGVLVVCQETTSTVTALKRLEWSESRFRSIVEQAPMAIALLTGPDLVVEVCNDQILAIWGKTRAIVGLPVMEALPEIREQQFPELLREVYNTGEPYFGYLSTAQLEHNGVLQDFHFDFVYKPLRDNAGNILGVIVMATDVSRQLNAVHELAESEQKFPALIEQAPMAICLFVGKHMVVEMANEPMIGYWGKGKQVLGQPLLKAVPELEGQPFPQLLDEAYETGVPYSSTNAPAQILMDGVLRTFYFNFTYKPLFDDSGKVFGIINMAVDVTKQVLAQKALEESEAKLRSVIASAPAAMGLFVGRELLIEMPNQAFIDIVGKGPEIVGKPLREVMPELESQPFLQILDDVYTSGKMFQSFGSQVNIVQNGVMTHHYYNITYTPIFDADGQVYAILDIAIDVTERVVAQIEMEESQMQLLSLFEESPVAIAIINKENLTFTMANPFYAEMVGRSLDQIIGKPLLEVLPEIESQGFDQLLRQVIETGVPFLSGEQAVELMRDGRLQTIYINLTYQPKKDPEGYINGVLVVATDTTQQVLARQKIQEAESTLRGAVELAELGTWEIDLRKDTMDFSKRICDWFKIGENEQITIPQVYASIHRSQRKAVRKAVENAMLPDSDRVFNIEFTLEPSEGIEERILHATGKSYINEKGQVYKINGTVQDVTGHRKIQLELENQVRQRTGELRKANQELAASNEELASINSEFMVINHELTRSNDLLARSNENLQQFAYVASHDLQEPLRKVQSFGDLLMKRYAEQLGGGEDYVRRMQQAAKRMSTLIDDLLTFSRLSVKQDSSEPVQLNEVVDAAFSVLEIAVQEAGAHITVDPLPVILGDKPQLEQLFQNLLSNALKFRKIGTEPVIHVTSRILAAAQLPPLAKPLRNAPAYHRIDIIDNGIGFDSRNADQIFQVFQRLHGKHEYPGTGIGLAICEKVVTNHGGAITAASREGEGATFTVFLPI
jgi:PAS domain S-box-containing protein